MLNAQHLNRVLMATVLGFTVVASVHAQIDQRQCAIPVESCSNCLSLRGDSTTPGKMRDRLVGAYDLVMVHTEGRPQKSISVSELMIRPWPVYDTIPGLGKVTRMIAYATLRGIASGLVTDSALKATPPRSPEFLRVVYREPNWLSLQTADDSAGLERQVVDQGGPILDAMEFDEGVLSGRWEEGGIVAMMYPTPAGNLIENDRGYFCAWKRR